MTTTDRLIHNMHWAATHAEQLAAIPGVFDIGVTRYNVSILAHGDEGTAAALLNAGNTDGPVAVERIDVSKQTGWHRVRYTTTDGVPISCTVFDTAHAEATA